MTKDRELQERVLRALDYEPGLNAANVGVTVHEGVVTLKGMMSTCLERMQAEQAIGRIYGVRAVANDIEVRLNPGARRDDSAIAEAAANSITWNTAVPPRSVKVAVRSGWLTLTGAVEWQFQREAAEHDLHRLFGVTGVTNMIRVKPKARPSVVRHKIEEALMRSAAVDAEHIEVQTKKGLVILRGHVRSLAERREAERAAWSAPGVTLVDDRLTVTA
ncbi:MAG TPA: BON domain-containing protein [Vicinamibacterales bacterium]|nr:BON domain-containing protein [Vicinamibacterales bacterium]